MQFNARKVQEGNRDRDKQTKSELDRQMTNEDIITRRLTLGKTLDVTNDRVLSRPFICTRRHEMTPSSGTDRDDDIWGHPFMTSTRRESRELCVFHVDHMWTSTRGEVKLMWMHVDRGVWVKNPIFLGTS